MKTLDSVLAELHEAEAEIARLRAALRVAALNIHEGMMLVLHLPPEAAGGDLPAFARAVTGMLGERGLRKTVPVVCLSDLRATDEHELAAADWARVPFQEGR